MLGHIAACFHISMVDDNGKAIVATVVGNLSDALSLRTVTCTLYQRSTSDTIR